MLVAVSQPLSLSARPAEAGRARGRTRRTTWRRFACATFLLVREKVKVLDVGMKTGYCRGWELLKNCQGYEKFYGMPELDKCERPPKRQRE